MLIKLFVLIALIVVIESESFESGGSSTSFDSLIALQCRARCLSLYPWKTLNNTQQTSLIDRKHRSNLFRNKRAFSSYNSSSGILSADSNHNSKHPPHNVKWNKVMEMCSKNANCLQCSLPCDIPTNLLSNCKYLCKHQNPLCIESCNLLNKLSEEKYGSCPNLAKNNFDECSNTSSKLAAQVKALRHNNEDSNLNEKSLNECSKDSDCIDVRKCCSMNPTCPEQGKVCLKPQINNQNLPSVPFNLTIVERKKGKTVILSWDCNYNKNKPTIFVVEGRWSLKPPQSNSFLSSNSDSDSYMTKWGYLAQSANNNWIILRNINRGRWYKFRVAAISKAGTYGYSKPTELFILSSAPKPPSEPQNLTVFQVYPSIKSDNQVNVDVGWLPSKRSDLPILNYKITWKRKVALNNNNTKNEKYTFDYESDEDSDTGYNVPASTDLNTINTAEYGSELVDAQGLNKFTIQNLIRYSIYSIELAAISSYDKELLISSAQRIRLDTSNLYPTESQSASLLISDTSMDQHSSLKDSNKLNNNEYDDDDDDEDEDLENNPIHASHSSERNQRLIVDQQVHQSDEINDFKRPLIRNLSIQSPYFQNGLVKAKLSWQIEDSSSKQPRQLEEVSINSITDQPMFTITWFAIKCVSSTPLVVLPQKQLPTPITATTINTNFEIYELKYNCDYVVNVRLATSKQNEKAPVSSSSLNRPAPPQIASAQFKVPSCNQIKLIGRIRPVCYTPPVSNDLSTTSKESVKNDVFKYLVNDKIETTQPTTISTTISTTSTASPDKTSILNPLPRVFNIKHKVIEKRNPNNKFYAVEFSWSLPYLFNKKIFNGYQISVVPKAIPGISLYQQNYDEDSSFVSFGSVGAIVDKEQQSFIVRQLRASIKYIFQIQLIGLDNQSYGPASSLEFTINETEDIKQQNQYQTKKAISLQHQNSRIDYDFNSYDTNDANYPFYLTTSKSNVAVSSSSLSSSNFFLNNSNRISFFKSIYLAVFLIFFSILTFKNN